MCEQNGRGYEEHNTLPNPSVDNQLIFTILLVHLTPETLYKHAINNE